MSVEAAPLDAEPAVEPDPGCSGTAAGRSQHKTECAKQSTAAFLHSPPDSNDAAKSDATDSELSDLEDEPILDDAPPIPSHVVRESDDRPSETPNVVDDLDDVLPDHWSGAVPVFRPTARQFSDFQRFMKKVDSYGMKSGIIKIIPPSEWKDAQPPLDDLVKYIKVREPIKQDIMGSNGTYRQVNILHGRSYNLPQWRQLCEQSEHQPPAKRGERRAHADKPKLPRGRTSLASKPAKPSTHNKRGKAKSAKARGKQASGEEEERPMTPVSPKEEFLDALDEPVESIERDGYDGETQDCQPSVGRMGATRQPKAKTQSVSARRKYSRREGSAMIDDEAFKDFDYRIDGAEYTPERCEELERAYWKTLTYAPPLYGADLMGTLFDDRTDIWNLNKLPNLLDVLGTKVPGVNTAYLYLGMWKATFAWHLEDVDLYSINYLHFGAPKQWYSISQADARRFEAAMKNIWPADAKACDQFLRHKSFLISPHHLLQHYGIKVNKVVSYPGEFVVTYPYGYHSGYNLGYNCAEAVNFALDSWLEMGKIAKRCECAQAQDSVWVNVYEIERKLRGEETEYEETEDEEEDDGDDAETSGLPTPSVGAGVRFKDVGRKRKRGPLGKRPQIKVKKIKLRLKAKAEPPCCLCPHDVPGLVMLSTDDGRKAHRMCALYVPETYIDSADGKEIVCNVSGIPKERLDLKCLFCRSKRGASFQCCKKKCARAYHATCAAAAGVFVEEQDVPVFGEDGTEFKEQAFEFSCRFHRTRRDKKKDGDALEADEGIRAAAASLVRGEIRQFQYCKGEIFAGMVVENRADEHTVLIDVMPNGERVEVEWKWLLLPDASDFRLPKASAKAVPLPPSRKAKDQLNAKRLDSERPRKDDVFANGYTWAEFQLEPVANPDQAKVDLAKTDKMWHYLGKSSTDARAQYTGDPSKPCHDPRSNFLDTIPKQPKPPPPPRNALAGPHLPQGGHAGPATHHAHANTGLGRPEKPYVYKPRKPIKPQLAPLMYVPQRPGPVQATYPSYPASSGGNASALLVSHNSPQSGPQYPGRTEAGHGPLGSQVQSPAASIPMPVPVRAAAPVIHRPPPHGAHPRPISAQQTRPSWQVHSSVYPRYPFFQVNHNRDASKYRSPYAPWGGFTNGYDCLTPRQSEVLWRSVPRPLPTAPNSTRPPPQKIVRQGGPVSSGPAQPNGPVAASAQDPVSAPARAPAPAPARAPGPAPASAPAASPPPTPGPAAASRWTDGGMPPPPVPGTSGRPLHPAIKPQYGLAAPPQTKTAAPAPKPYKVGMPAAINLALKSTKPAVQVPPRQSPVPLPANFLAAIASSPGGSQSASSSAQAPSLQAPNMQPPKPVMLPPASGSQSSAARTQSQAVPVTRGEADERRAALSKTVSEGKSLSDGSHDGLRGSSMALQQEFSDVPGSESMKFVERMMENLKRVSQLNKQP
ncbi:hypothetical protein L249_3231 [Ophiocordyceps polyrhachis-furcata BCC 54312]|uniref:[histone H3]-trimethyl-L-lysine(9) demethylase n=1 Tax=Ophiocordyceps polyrhachis-furcata BCC 54312 TaxID=1330021 RepID=A0A367LMX7_9HYPO|nr:hypothetical protein L249_3231 [Ophiocordyceps polyrhachis-furcata BCC 54312]